MVHQTRMMKKLLLASTLLIASTSLYAAEHWIDVRDASQFQENHVSGAVNIPLSQIDHRISEVTQNKNDTLHLYCNTGNNSSKAEVMLKDMGYTHVVNEGGLKDVEKTQTMIKK